MFSYDFCKDLVVHVAGSYQLQSPDRVDGLMIYGLTISVPPLNNQPTLKHSQQLLPLIAPVQIHMLFHIPQSTQH